MDIDTSKDRATGACCSTTEDTASFHKPRAAKNIVSEKNDEEFEFFELNLRSTK